MRRIKTVDIVGRHSTLLAPCINGGRSIGVLEEDALKRCRDLLAIWFAVGLDHGQSKRRRPGHGRHFCRLLCAFESMGRERA